MGTDMPACFAFSLAKCGSTMMNRALQIVNDRLGVPETNLPGRFFREGVPVKEWIRRDVSDVIIDGFMHRGYRYLPANVAASPLLRSRKSILLLRDARDAATSHYFSKVYEHPAPGGDLAKTFNEARALAAERGIAVHVVNQARRLQWLWRSYMASLPKDPALVRVYRYEDIVFGKRDWLEDVYAFFEIDAPEAVIAEAAAAVDVFPERENVRARARKVAPGDHLEKLDADTIKQVNAVARDYLCANGYL